MDRQMAFGGRYKSGAYKSFPRRTRCDHKSFSKSKNNNRGRGPFRLATKIGSKACKIAAMGRWRYHTRNLL